MLRPYSRVPIRVRNDKTKRSLSSGKPASVFIDSGASITIFPRRASDALQKIGPWEERKAIVHTANGAREVNAMQNVHICLGKVCHKGQAIILEDSDVPGDLIVGSDFLRASKCSVDFDKKKLKCKGRKLPFSLEES